MNQVYIIYIYTYIQLPCEPSPPPCLLRSLFLRVKVSKKMNPQNHQKRQKQASKIAQKSYKIDAWRGPGGSRGRFWDHFGPQREPSRKNDEKGTSPTPPGLLLGTLGRPWAPSGRHFLRFWVSGRRSVRRSPFRWPERAAQEVPETPSNHETEGFAYTKTLFSHFHPYLHNDRKWAPMGTLLGRFSVVLGTLGAKKSQKSVPEGALGG